MRTAVAPGSEGGGGADVILNQPLVRAIQAGGGEVISGTGTDRRSFKTGGDY